MNTPRWIGEPLLRCACNARKTCWLLFRLRDLTKGLLESTTVFVTGEFGRTPRINSRSAEGGRDHYPRCMFMLLAGGGVQGGQVVRASNDNATAPLHESFSPEDVAAT